MTATATLRHFNRTYTQRIGVLEESFLGLGMPLAAARLIFEVGVEGTTVRELRDRLGLDSGYLSRLLRTLQDRGQVLVEPDPSDLRRRRVALTQQGWSTYRRLDESSERLAEGILQPLTERQRGPSDRRVGDRRPAGPCRDRPAARGRSSIGNGYAGGGAVLRRAEPPVPRGV
jgi:DNA-binding MarR family transcriptional regulator